MSKGVVRLASATLAGIAPGFRSSSKAVTYGFGGGVMLCAESSHGECEERHGSRFLAPNATVVLSMGVHQAWTP
jgi:hypothetical protein